MSLSKKRRALLYGIIHGHITEARIKLKLDSEEDWLLAQLTDKIFDDIQSLIKGKNK